MLAIALAIVPLVVTDVGATGGGDSFGPSDTHSSHPHPSQTFAFADGDHERVLIRGDTLGTDSAPVEATFVDPGTGRHARALVGDTVIVRAPVSSLASLDVIQVRSLMPHLDMILVRSARNEDAALLAHRLMPLVLDGTLRAAYPNLAFPHRLHSVDVPPNDPRYPGQFYFDEIEIEEAWAVTTGSADVTVLIADNGCDLQHPDLIEKLDPGFDPFDDDDDPSYEPGEGNEHGTACAGLVAASTDNDIDIAGTCPACRLRCARLLPADGEPVTVSSDVLTFNFAFEQNVDVVSNSWGFIDAIPVPGPLRDAIIDVQQNGRDGKGAVVAFASGNDSRNIDDDELLAVPGILGVGAVNNLGELTQFSNRGASVDVVAPTGTITTDISGPEGADPGDVTAQFGGTSSACPIAAGVAALVIAHRPDLTADEVNRAMQNTARQSAFATPNADDHDDSYGFGLVQPFAAITFFDEEPPPEPPSGCTCDTSHPMMGGGFLALLFVVTRRSSRRSFAA